MATKNFRKRSYGSEKSEPKVIGEVLVKYFASNEPLAAAYRERLHPDTFPCVNLKVLKREPGRMPVGANLNGMLTRDGMDHFKFVESQPWAAKRYPRVFEGRYITITRRDDGSLHPNFREMPVGEEFSPERYAAGVANELMWALEGLIEE